jgi:hypothetical protein
MVLAADVVVNKEHPSVGQDSTVGITILIRKSLRQDRRTTQARHFILLMEQQNDC